MGKKRRKYLKMGPHISDYILPAKFFVVLCLLRGCLAITNQSVVPFSLAHCQYSTPNPLEGCATGTILVSRTILGAFSTIQSAIDSIQNSSSHATILVTGGNYTEQLNVTRKAPLTLLGQTACATAQNQNLVTVYWSAANVNASYSDNAFTSILTVAPNLNASLTGSGPWGFSVPSDTPLGCDDFKVYNIDFRNVFSEYSVGPSLALSTGRANTSFYQAGFYSLQDTVCLKSQ